MNEFDAFTDAELEEMRADLHSTMENAREKFISIGLELERRLLAPKVADLLAQKAEIEEALSKLGVPNVVIGMDTLTLKGEAKIG